ncbi:MAG TPA: pyridoxamine 5'-phosphate oxidase family protein [Patescibacteria group bacterium]
MTHEDFYNLLSSHNVAVVSIITPENTPYGACLYYIIDHNLNFFFLTKFNTKKAEYLQKNNNVALTIVDPIAHITFQAQGKVESVEDPEMHVYIMRRISELVSKDKGPAQTPSSKMPTDGAFVFKVTPNWLRYGDFTKSIPEEIFTQIIPEPTQEKV